MSICLRDYATERLPVRVRATYTNTEPPTVVEGTILPMWHEADRAPGEPHERADVWRVIWIDGDASTGLTFRSGSVNELDTVEIAGPAVTSVALPILAQPTVQGNMGRVEIVLLAARLGLTVSFGYTKDDAARVEEERRGVPLGYRAGKDGALLVLADADRAGEKRSFKAARITALRLVHGQALPIWVDGSGWTMPAPVPARDPLVTASDL